VSTVDPLRYGAQPAPSTQQDDRRYADETLWVKVRYKQPGHRRSLLIERPVSDKSVPYVAASRDFKFVSAVAMLAMQLRGSQYVADLDPVILRQSVFEGAGGSDEKRRDFVMLYEQARRFFRR
jgi:Ca-activated chloride channel family protein